MKKFYHYTKQSFPPEARELLKKAGFRMKRNLWWRIQNDLLIQYVAICKAYSTVCFSSQPLFCADSVSSLFDTYHLPAYEEHKAGEIYGIMHNIPWHHPILQLYTNDVENGEKIISELITQIISEIVLPRLDQVHTVEENFCARKEWLYLQRLKHESELTFEEFDYARQCARDAPYYELLYLGKYDQCAEFIRGKRAADIRYHEEMREIRSPETIQSSIEFYGKQRQNILEIAENRNVSAARELLRQEYAYVKSVLMKEFKAGESMELRFPEEH